MQNNGPKSKPLMGLISLRNYKVNVADCVLQLEYGTLSKPGYFSFLSMITIIRGSGGNFPVVNAATRHTGLAPFCAHHRRSGLLVVYCNARRTKQDLLPDFYTRVFT